MRIMRIAGDDKRDITSAPGNQTVHDINVSHFI